MHKVHLSHLSVYMIETGFDWRKKIRCHCRLSMFQSEIVLGQEVKPNQDPQYT